MCEKTADVGKRRLQAVGGATEMFVIRSVEKAEGGVSPCFLYEGHRAGTPQRACKRRNIAGLAQHGVGTSHPDEDRLVPDGGVANCSTASELLSLYISYEEASPSPKLRRLHGSSQAAAPFRVCLWDAEDDRMLVSYRVPPQVFTDDSLLLARWGPLCIAFPTSQDLCHFANCLRRVAITACDLSADTPKFAAPFPCPAPAAPRCIPPPPPAWVFAEDAPPAHAWPLWQLPAPVAVGAPVGPNQAQEGILPICGGAAQQELQGQQHLPCTPPSYCWAFTAATPAVEPLTLATPPPLNRTALSGDGSTGHACSGLLPTPVPFVLPAVCQPSLLPSDAVAAAIAMLEAGIEGRGW